MPVVLIIHEPSCGEPIKILGRALKKGLEESGIMVAELQGESGQRQTAIANFHPQSDMFVVSISPTVVSVESGSQTLSPSLFLVSNEDSIHRPEIQWYLGDPHAIVVSLLEPLDAYCDDGAKTLWIIRCVLKFMKASQQIQRTTSNSHTIQSRL